jgi:hypothetical protein
VSPLASVAPLTVAVYVVEGESGAEGTSVAVAEEVVTVAATEPAGLVSAKERPGVIASLKAATTDVEADTPVAPPAGEVEITVGITDVGDIEYEYAPRSATFGLAVSEAGATYCSVTAGSFEATATPRLIAEDPAASW